MMALSDTKLRKLKPADKAYQEADEGGLFVEVMPGGAKVWRLRYPAGGSKQEKVTLGDYPAYSLAEARTWRDDWQGADRSWPVPDGLAARRCNPRGCRPRRQGTGASLYP
jgi:hypothetical protein